MADTHITVSEQEAAAAAASAAGQPPTAQTTGDGFLVGTEPSEINARRTFEAQQAAGQQGQVFTADQVEKFRQEERDKVMKRLEKSDAASAEMRKQVEELTAARKLEEDAKSAAEAEKARLEEEATNDKLSTKEYVRKMETDFQGRFEQMETDRKNAEALLDKERQFHALSDYRTQRLSDPEIMQNLIPHLTQYIGGSTQEEIDASIQLALQTSAGIVAEVQGEQQRQRQAAPGVSSYAPATGPIDESTQPRQLTPQQIAAMPMQEYARYRDQLLSQARPPR